MEKYRRVGAEYRKVRAENEILEAEYTRMRD